MRIVAVVLAVLVLVGGVCGGAAWALWRPAEPPKMVTVLGEPESSPLKNAVNDDQIETKSVPLPGFESELTHRDRVNGLEINNSESVLKLDLDLVDPKTEPVFVKLYPSYQAARNAAKSLGPEKSDVLVSASMIFSMTRDFDHGLIVVAERALVHGDTDAGVGVVPLLKTFFGRLPKTSAVRPYVAAALETAGEKVEVFPEEVTRKNIWLNRYRTQTLAVAPPLDYYTWSEENRKLYHFVRFVQDAFPGQFYPTVLEMGQKFLDNPDLLAQYNLLANLFQLLSRNRREFLVLDFASVDPTDDINRRKVVEKHQDFLYRLQFIPETSRRERIHFQEFLPMGCLRELDAFAELTQRSMIGLVTLMPREGRPGIEQVQAIAMDAFLAEPKDSSEGTKALLTRVFRERLMRPNYAVERLTSDPSTIRQWKAWTGSDSDRVCPKLRVEPVPPFYLRLARNYRYIGQVVMPMILGENTYAAAKRMTPEGGFAEDPMPVEIERIMNLFYGLYLVSCEDLGVRPNLGEQDGALDREACYQLAVEWLPRAFDSPEAARDARYSTIVDFRPFQREIICWSGIGVRLQKLLAAYARRPQARENEDDLWRPLEDSELGVSRYVLPVLEFAGVDLRARFGIDPGEFREICDKNPDRQAIYNAIYALEPPSSGLSAPADEGEQQRPAAAMQQPAEQPSLPGLPGLPDPLRTPESNLQEGLGVTP